MNGEVHPHYCYFTEEQDANITVINEFKGDRDIDEKCLLAMCSTHAGFEDRLKDHINIKHRNYNTQSKIKLPPFWKYLKINVPDSPSQISLTFSASQNILGLITKFTSVHTAAGCNNN
jgi:hypothetical protein